MMLWASRLLRLDFNVFSLFSDMVPDEGTKAGIIAKETRSLPNERDLSFFRALFKTPEELQTFLGSVASCDVSDHVNAQRVTSEVSTL